MAKNKFLAMFLTLVYRKDNKQPNKRISTVEFEKETSVLFKAHLLRSFDNFLIPFPILFRL